MWYLIIRIISVISFGIATYSILLWCLYRKMPGRARRHLMNAYNENSKRKLLIVLGYLLLLAILIIMSFVLIKFKTRGEL